MKKRSFLISLVLPLLVACANFGNSSSSSEDLDDKGANGETNETSISTPEPDETGIENGDYTQKKSIDIVLANGATTTTDATKVTIDQETNIITITAIGIYVVTGTLTNGQILVDCYRTDSDDTVEIQLNGASISSSFAAPIFSQEKNDGTYKDVKLKIKKVASSSSIVKDNRPIAQAETYEGDDNAAIFANSDLSIVGAGKLSVTSTFNNGVGSDDELKVKNGELVISSPNNALKAHDRIEIGDDAGEDSSIIGATSLNGNGIRQDEAGEENGVFVYSSTLVVNAKNDGIDSEQDIEINDSDIQVVTGGGSTVQSGTSKVTLADSIKGIKATNDLTINSGNIIVSSRDDALHSNHDIVINDGTLSLMSDDDGIHADNQFTLNDGTISVTQSYEGFEATEIIVNGGNTSVRARDDGWNAAGGSDNGSNNPWGGSSSTGTLTINGGLHYVNSVGDGIDSNGNIFMTGGTVIVEGPTSTDNGPLDVGDSGNYFEQTGGLMFAIGSSGMAVGATKGNQVSILARGVNASSGDYYVITDSANTPLYAFRITQTSQSCYFSAPGLNYGTYEMFKAQLTDGKEIMNQLYSDGSISYSTQLCSWTWSASNVHATYGSSGGGGRS